MKIRKTDYGTIILHWVLVGAISVTIVTGLRMATEGPDHLWLNALDGFVIGMQSHLISTVKFR